MFRALTVHTALPGVCWPCAGTGKTTLLRALAAHQIKGIPDNCQILHVEQEVHPSLPGLLEHVWLCCLASFIVLTLMCSGTVRRLACLTNKLIDM